jgi:hypothetical protein
MFNRFMAAAAIATAILGWSSASQAQSPRDAEIIGFHQLCDKGDRKACVRFGMLIEHNRDMHAEWRRSHPEFFWWEH